MSAIVQARPGRQWQQCRVAPSALALMESARHGLAAAEDEPNRGRQVRERAPGGVCARRPPSWPRGPSRLAARRRRGRRACGSCCRRSSPALREWAAFFAAGAAKRAAAEAGLPRAVSAHEADELLRDAAAFVSLAEGALGIEREQELLPLPTAG